MTVNFAAVRERHPLATVARRTGYVLPEPRGDVFVACPMAGHDDSTPSMLLHLDEDRYHCFGCGASGTSCNGCATCTPSTLAARW